MIFFYLIQNSTYAFAASFLYLPHGLRVLATLIGGRKIIPGIMSGHVVSGVYIHTFSNITGIEILDMLNLKTVIVRILNSIGNYSSVLL